MTNIKIDDKDLCAVMCGGCHMFYLGNTGLDSDPVKCVTYQDLEDLGKIYICSMCWASPHERKLN